MTLEQFLDLGVDMDLDGVELTSYYFPDTETSTLYDVKRMALRRGLEVSGAAVGNNFCQADPAKRAEHVQMVKDWIYNSVKLGAPLLRVFAGPVPDGSSEDDACEWTIASLQECAEVAAQEGVMLALENHGGITATVEQVEGLIAATDSDWVAVNLDTGNYRTDPYGSITRTVPMAITAHVKTEVPGPNGKEDVDIESVINALNAGGYRGYLSIEYEASEDPTTAVPRFVETLQRLVR